MKPIIAAALVRLLLGIALAIPGTAMAQIFLKIEGIDGGATTDGYEKQIEIDSFSWGLAAPVSSGGGTRSVGKVSASEVALTKRTDNASPGLAMALLSAKAKEKAEISFLQTGATKPERYIHLTLCDVFVTSVSTSAAADAPVESFTLNLRAFRLVYTDLDAAGPAKTSNPVVWDFSTNTASGCN